MANSVVIPQDIIDKIIETVDDDSSLLKRCALVSSSSLFPSRKRLVSRLYLQSDSGCQRLQQFFVENPLLLPSVRKLYVTLDWGFLGYHKSRACYFRLNGTSLIVILQLPFCCLESLDIVNLREILNWNDFSSELKDAFSTIIHSPYLKTLCLNSVNVPIMLVQGIHLKKLILTSVVLDGQRSTLPASEGMATTVIDQDVWIVHMWNQVRGPTEPVFLPFMCRLRVFEMHFDPSSAKMGDFQILSFMIRSQSHISSYTRTSQDRD